MAQTPEGAEGKAGITQRASLRRHPLVCHVTRLFPNLSGVLKGTLSGSVPYLEQDRLGDGGEKRRPPSVRGMFHKERLLPRTPSPHPALPGTGPCA